MKTPYAKVSVIIPVYNVEQYIEKCITSVLSQTYKNIEIIIIDDCGSDKSIQIAESLISGLENRAKILYNQCNQGPSISRNNGINVVSGKYFYLLDSDDYIDCDAIEKLVACADSTDADMVVGCIKKCEDNKETYIRNEFPAHASLSDIRAAFYRNEFKPYGSHKLINLEQYRKSGVIFYPGIFHEDLLWLIQLLYSFKRIEFVNDSILNYQIRPQSTSTSNDNYDLRAKSFAVILKEMYTTARVKSIPDMELFDMCWITYFTNAYSLALNTNKWSIFQKAAFIKDLLQIRPIPWDTYRKMDPRGRFVYAVKRFVPSHWALLFRAKLAELFKKKK